jgi:hypothetical protein
VRLEDHDSVTGVNLGQLFNRVLKLGQLVVGLIQQPWYSLLVLLWNGIGAFVKTVATWMRTTSMSAISLNIPATLAVCAAGASGVC